LYVGSTTLTAGSVPESEVALDMSPFRRTILRVRLEYVYILPSPRARKQGTAPGAAG